MKKLLSFNSSFRVTISVYRLILVLVTHQALYGQTLSSYSVKHFTDENGLPQNSVKAIAADSAGFLWLATESGLVRFDGTRFNTYNKADLPLERNRIYTFLPAVDNVDTDFYASVTASQIVNIKKGRPSIGETSALRTPISIQKEYEATLLDLAPHGVVADRYLIAVPGAAGSFFLCHRDRIEYYVGWKKKNSTPVGTMNMSNIFQIGADLLHLEDNGGIVAFAANAKPMRQQLQIGGDLRLNPLFQTRQGQIKLYWNGISGQAFFTLGPNMYLLTADIRNGLLRTRLLLSGFDLEAHDVKSVFFDAARQRLFLGCSTDGLFEFTRKTFRVLTNDKDQASNIFYDQEIYSDSSVVVPNGYELGINRQGVAFQRQMPFIQQIHRFPWYMLVDRDGNQWMRSDSSVARFNPQGTKVTGKWQLGSLPTSFYQHEDGSVWVLLENGKLYRFQPARRPKMPKLIANLPTSIASFASSGDTLWIGTEKGLYNIDLRSGHISVFRATRQMNIRSLYLSGAGQLWLSTYENGIQLFENKRLHSFPLDREKYLSTAHCIFEDKRHFFWVTTNKGLFQFAKDDLMAYVRDKSRTPYYQYYSKENGLATNEFNGGCQPCAVQLANGYVSLPSMKGLVWFKPEMISPEVPSRVLFIDKVEIAGKSLPVANDTLRLPFNPAPFDLNVAAPFFGDQNSNNIYYALEIGRSISDWVRLTPDKVIHFANLPSGSHTLYLKKQAGFGAKSLVTYKFTIQIEKAWYETYLAWAGAAALLLILILGAVRFQNRRLIKKNQILEEAISKRTRSLNETMEALQDSEDQLFKQVKIQQRMIASITHDVKTPLKAVSTVSSEIDKLLNEGKLDQVRVIGKSVAETSIRINTLLENTVTYIKLQMMDGKLGSEMINLHNLVGEKVSLFTMAARKHNTSILNEIPVGFQLRSNVNLLGIVLGNLIDNAVKNTVGGSITIKSELSGPNVHISVKDSGFGIPDKYAAWLNEDYPAAELQHGQNQGASGGMGLLIVKEIVGMMGAQIHAQRTADGTIITVLLESEEYA